VERKGNQMAQESGNSKSILKVVLDGELTIQRASELKEAFMAHQLSGKTLHVDLSNVSAIDVSGLQLICSLHKTAQSCNGSVRIASPVPEPIRQTLKRTGFAGRQSAKPNCGCTCLWDPGEQV
jgi:anti-anti-sigma factor